jgi:hypothetical protein
MDLLTLLIILLIIAWAMGSFVFPVGNLIHLLLVIVIVIIAVRLIRGQSI